MIRRIRVLGIPILSIETDDPDDQGRIDDLDGRVAAPVGFVRDDLPTYHRREEADQ